MNSLSRKRSLKWDTSSSSSSSSSPWSSPAAKRRKKTTAISCNDNSNSKTNSKSNSKSKRESKLESKLKWKKEKNGNNEMVEGCETRDCMRQTIKAKTNELNDLWNELKHINNNDNNGNNNGNNNDNNDWNEKSKKFMLKAEKCINDNNGILNNCVNKIENEILKPLNNEKENLKYLTKTFKSEMNDIKTNNNEKINKITNQVSMLETKMKKYQTKILDLSKEKKKLQRELTFESKNIESQLKKTSNQLNKLKKEEILWNDDKNTCYQWISTPNDNDNAKLGPKLIKQFKNELDSLKKKLIENSNNIEGLCIACYDAKPCVKYCGCNHESLCYPCYSKWNIDNSTCPLCRKQKFRVTIKF